MGVRPRLRRMHLATFPLSDTSIPAHPALSLHERLHDSQRVGYLRNFLPAVFHFTHYSTQISR